MIIAVDFDGTCVEHKFPKLGKDAPHAVRVLRRIAQKGHQIMLWTMRSEGSEHPAVLDDAVAWFEFNEIDLWGVNLNPEQGWSKSRKQYANIYIDDAALGCPLVKPEGFDGPVVDWLAVEKRLTGIGLLDQIPIVEFPIKSIS